MSELRQPVWLREADAPALPLGWRYLTTEEACEQLKPGKLFENKTVKPEGSVPVINQSLDGIIGYHDEQPGVEASPSQPVVTFANHTCAMRLMKEPFSCIQNVFPKIGREGVTDTRFFYYASLGRVSISDYKGHHPVFRETLIPVPPLPTQRKIAGILSAYDDLIENNLRRIKILEEMAQSLYSEWFVHFRFPGHDFAEFDDSELGPIPRGWTVKKLGELADQMRRGVPKGQLDGAVRYVGLEHIPRKSLALDAWEEIAELGSNKLTFERGEVLFGKIRPYFHKVSVAPFDGICSADTIVIRSKKPEHRALVTACVFTDAFVAHAAATSNGSKMPRTDWKVLKDYPLILPPKDLLARFSALFENAVEQQQNLISRNQTLHRTRDLLLPQLLA